MSSDAASSRAQFGICADLLEQGRRISTISVPVSVTAAIAAPVLIAGQWLPAAWTVLAVAIALTGIIERILAFRTRLDAALLRRIERAPGSLDGALSDFDTAMIALRLMPASKAHRGAAARLAGCLRLLRWQVAAVGVQWLLLLLGAPMIELLT